MLYKIGNPVEIITLEDVERCKRAAKHLEQVLPNSIAIRYVGT